MSKHTVELAFNKNVPSDVLMEHLGYALRVFGITGAVLLESHNDPDAERYHPFDGPEMFDDYVEGNQEKAALNVSNVVNYVEANPEFAFPNLANVVNRLRREYRDGKS